MRTFICVCVCVHLKCTPYLLCFQVEIIIMNKKVKKTAFHKKVYKFTYSSRGYGRGEVLYIPLHGYYTCVSTPHSNYSIDVRLLSVNVSTSFYSFI